MLLLTGALTSKPYAFTSRPWELRSVQSIDVLDGIGSNIRLDFKESEVLRVLPRRNLEINENWISDKIRFFYDGLKRQRLTSPYIKINGELKVEKWKKVISKFSSLLKVYSFEYGPSSVGLLGSSSLDLESLYSIRSLSSHFGFSFLGIDKNFKIDIDNSKNYKFQNRISDFEKTDFCLFVGTNPRFEASSLNLRLRKIFRRGATSFASIGGNYATTFPIDFLSLTSKALVAITQGKHPICKSLAKAKKPTIIYGSKLLERSDQAGLCSLLKAISASYFNVFSRNLTLNLLHTTSNSVGAFELGIKSFTESDLSKIKVLYTIGLENSSFLEKSLKKARIPAVVRQSSHGDQVTKNACIILPSYTFVEKTGIFYNTEGRPQKTQRALVGPNLSRDDWKILRVLFSALEKQSSYNTKSQLITEISKILPSAFFANMWFTNTPNTVFNFGSIHVEKIYNSSFKLFIEDFYMTSILCLSSKIMAKASELLRSYMNNYRFLNWISVKI